MIDPVSLSAVGRFAVSRLGIGIIAALLLACAWLRGNSYQTERDALKRWKDEVVSATRDAAGHPKLGEGHVSEQVRALGRTIQNYRTATAEARRRAIENKVTVEAGNELKRKEANNAYREQLIEARRLGDAVADARRVRSEPKGTAGDGCSGPTNTNLPGPSIGTKVADRSCLDAGMVAIPREEWNGFIQNTTRLLNARDWALDTAAPVPTDRGGAPAIAPIGGEGK